MPRHFLKLSYLGTAYHGWQRQPNAISVQQCIEDAMAKILRSERIPINGCGRTDTGVHATEFFAHFDADLDPDLDLAFKLNAFMPDDIAIQELIPVGDKAHARFDATEREYVYRVHVGKHPFERHWSRRLWAQPNVELMNEAAQLLISTEVFTSFARVNTEVKTDICDVRKAIWTVDGDCLSFTISANRFLRNMVRAIVGTLLEIGQGKRPLSEMQDIINALDRSAAGTSAPAVGLSLSRIEYPYLHRQ